MKLAPKCFDPNQHPTEEQAECDQLIAGEPALRIDVHYQRDDGQPNRRHQSRPEHPPFF
jgi:hypothetical protein